MGGASGTLCIVANGEFGMFRFTSGCVSAGCGGGGGGGGAGTVATLGGPGRGAGGAAVCCAPPFSNTTDTPGGLACSSIGGRWRESNRSNAISARCRKTATAQATRIVQGCQRRGGVASRSLAVKSNGKRK